MRLSILINTPDPTNGHEYAVLWLDTEHLDWSLETRHGIELPKTGDMHDVDGVLMLCDHGCDEPFVTLHGMNIDRRGNIHAAQGSANWVSGLRHKSVNGHWRLRAVERNEPSHRIPPAGNRASVMHTEEPVRRARGR
ncbi:DUF3564 family protein [Paraburkholderia rhizosphaerae]|uniref:Uncharacterized protein DUF3564 n=1 Tax=Paraburkholderia rhizosphaerae TaxID=480658 RepID=A0A4V3HDV6_9BURK|nr:DUF3564 family protein [Paraburkholderia rhizosphaerae]TDY42519.1 uncharacterized protein DUF3564 [Paraburkholderia rhizosphaerae]